MVGFFVFVFVKCAPFPTAPYHYHFYALPMDLPALWEQTVGNEKGKGKRWVGVTLPPFIYRTIPLFTVLREPFSKQRSNTRFKLVCLLSARSTLRCFAEQIFYFCTGEISQHLNVHAQQKHRTYQSSKKKKGKKTQ